MHAEAWAFVSSLVPNLAPGHVVEFGARNFNGSIRPLFSDALSYTGVDILPGANVDVVSDAAEFSPEVAPDLILCCETLEHTPRGEDIVANAARILAPGGQLVVTCATSPRAPHSAVDGGELYRNEYYANVAPDDLARWMQEAGLAITCRQVHSNRGDLYAVAEKGAR